jgi:hypothetical protein
MNEELKAWLERLLDVVSYGFSEIEDRCQPSLDWEINQIKKLREELSDVD